MCPARDVPPRGVGREIRQTRPFRSLAQETTVALLRTASVVSRTIARVLEPHGLSLAQYNALRIIRGAGSSGLPTLAVRDRMIEEGTTITRILDRLEAAELIRRRRGGPDRRVVLCQATAKGARLLALLDPAVDAADEAAMTGLGADHLRRLVDLLERVREANAVRGAPRSARIGDAG